MLLAEAAVLTGNLPNIFQAQDSEERERWIRALEDTVVRHNQVRRVSTRRVGSTAAAGASIEDFDRKLTETDSYLELLLGQVRPLDRQLYNQ